MDKVYIIETSTYSIDKQGFEYYLSAYVCYEDLNKALDRCKQYNQETVKECLRTLKSRDSDSYTEEVIWEILNKYQGILLSGDFDGDEDKWVEDFEELMEYFDYSEFSMVHELDYI